VDLTSEDKITDEAVRAAAEAIEDETFRRIGPGRNLDDIHREGIARAALLAALPLLGTAWPGDRVECADCGRTSGYCKCGDIDAAEMARLMRERVLRESAQDECSGYEDFVADGPDEVVLPLVTAAAAEKIAEARYRAGREDAARTAIDLLMREQERANGLKRERESERDAEGVMCCLQYLDGLKVGITALEAEKG
jgi:hypothetical protein